MWIVGSSIIKRASWEARTHPGGLNLSFRRIDIDIWWNGKGGMLSSMLRKHINSMLLQESSPHFLLIHVGANDLGNLSLLDLRHNLDEILQCVQTDLPSTRIIWSQMLPRLKWRYSQDKKAMQKGRYRVNNKISSLVLKSGGYYLRHPGILRVPKFFDDDGVHLSEFAQSVFLLQIQKGLQFFIQNKGHVYPPSYMNM